MFLRGQRLGRAIDSWVQPRASKTRFPRCELPAEQIFLGRTVVFKTYIPANSQPGWVIVDASGQTLGRLATQIATIIRGKHKPDYTPHLANGDIVIVINAKEIALTGNKMDGKVYTRFTGYPGGLKKQTAREAIAKHPERVIEHAVFGMLPKGRLGRTLHNRLKVYAGDQHPHAAQQPKKFEVK